MTTTSTSGSAEPVAQAAAEVAAARRGRVLRLTTDPVLPEDALVVDFADRPPGTVAEADALVGELRLRLRPGSAVVLALLGLDRAEPPLIWRDYLLDTLLAPLLETRALLVVVTETGAPRGSDASVSVADRLRLLRAEREGARIVGHLDAIADALEPDEHLRHARRAYARAPEIARRQLADAAERVGWTGDALALSDDPRLVVTRQRRFLQHPVESHLGLAVPRLDLEAELAGFDDTPWWRHERAELAALRGEPARALELAADAPDTAEVHRLRARCHEALGRPGAAVAAYRAALRLEPTAADLVQLARLVPDADEAVTLAAHAVLLSQRHWLALGRALARRGDRLVGLRVAAAEADADTLVEAFGVARADAEQAREWATRPHWNRLEFVTAATGVDRRATDAFLQRTS
jgi:tetratricopeptide (TPR) repeat protein